MRARQKHAAGAFTLIELLVVIAIMAVLAALAIPAFNSFAAGNSLGATAQAVEGALDLARQTALTQNQFVEVRLYKLPRFDQISGAPAEFRGMQLFSIQSTNTNALTKPIYFESPVIVSTDVKTTSLMDDVNLPETAAGAADVNLGAIGKNYRYRRFRYKSDGSTDLSLTNSWFLSLIPRNAAVVRAQGLPANFITIQVDPQNGRTTLYQP